MAERLSIRPGITARLTDVLPEQFQVETLAGSAVLTHINNDPRHPDYSDLPMGWQWEVETSFYRGTVDRRQQVVEVRYCEPAPWKTIEDALDGLEMLVADWVTKNPDLAQRALRERRGVSYV